MNFFYNVDNNSFIMGNCISGSTNRRGPSQGSSQQAYTIGLHPTPACNETAPYRVGAWLPSDQAILDNWVKTLIEEVDGVEQIDGDEVDAFESSPALHPVIQDFKELVEKDAEVNMFFTQMFNQVPNKYPYNDPSKTGKPLVRNYQQMLRLINAIMTKAPEYNKTGLVDFPINAILDWPMGTTGGFATFLNAKVNIHIKKILSEWGTFLKSEHSLYVLNTDPKTW